MKIKFTICCILLSGIYFFGFAQPMPQEATTPALDLILPDLDVFVDGALAKNGMLNYRKLDLEVRESDVKTQRRLWTQNMGIRGDVRYGTFNNFVTNVEGVNNSAITTFSEQINYGIGLYIQLPIFDIFNTNNQTKRAKVQVSQAQSLVEDQQLIIRELVIRQYEDLQLKFELLKIHSTNYGNAKVNMEMVEKEFRNGQLIVYEYVRLGDITARIQTDYEKAKSDYLLAKQVLENTSGISIQ
ncbi:TolC family protein [Aureitalea marina]|uniref:Transporter n=1 Tax=Aureitalea marina TaxID=930804 RepID=A0A2S7KR33_9FLAO|nr:TolC family protein [Aureitalea marina]PQB05081.1 hypothetical protein BST85_09375 [Aureitalea marina]